MCMYFDTLESDILFLKAERIEIPASITAVEFYRKKGYDYKNGIKELDHEQHYRLEKFRKPNLRSDYNDNQNNEDGRL